MIAHGHPRYAKQAVTLARSMRLHNPDIPIAVGTDLDPRFFLGLFDAVVPWKFQRRGFLSKLDMYDISPFEKTLFLDSDIIVWRPLSMVFDRFAGEPFAVMQDDEPRGTWYENLERLRSEFGEVERIRFNGGLYYFEKCDAAERLFRDVASIETRYDDLGVERLYGKLSDEPMFGLIMSREGIAVTADHSRAYWIATTWPHGKPYYIDSVAGECWHLEGKEKVHRVMMHFYGGAVNSYRYRREALRLALVGRYPVQRAAADRLLRLFGAIVWALKWPWRRDRFSEALMRIRRIPAGTD